MRFVTQPLLRSPRIAAIGLGAVGVLLAGVLLLTWRVHVTVALAIGLYAAASAAVCYFIETRKPAAGSAPRPVPTASSPTAVLDDDAPRPTLDGPATRLNAAEPPQEVDLREPLTGLATRALFRDRLAHALTRAHRHERPVAVMLIDVDGFRGINDAFGYAAGDRVLAAVASRLGSALRGGDTAARLGADEFALLLEDMADESNFIQIGDRVSDALGRPIALDGREVTISTCTGIARATADDDADGLLRNVDAALAAAKRRGRGACELFSERLRSSLVARADLESDLRAAVDAKAFDIEYQPIVILHSRRIAGVEALLRWRHPSRGDIAPATFLPVADDLGLAPALGRWVLQQACAQVKGWQDQVAAARALTLTVNISRAQLRQPTLIADVQHALTTSRLDPRRLVLEVSDAVLLDDAGTALARLQALKTLGVRIAIDDFGARHAALHQLPRIPVDILKIDKAFIDRVGRTGGSVSVAHVVLALGKSMRLRTVAEGVEAEEQVVELLRLKCEFGQGMLFSRPLSPAATGALLRGARR